MEKNSISTPVLVIGAIVIGLLLLFGFRSILNSSTEGWELKYAEQLGLDLEKFKSDLANEEVKNRVKEDIKEGESRGVDSTPSIFVNGELMVFTTSVGTELEQKILEEFEKTNQKVLVEEFSDFQCPACKGAAEDTGLIREYYADKIEFIYKHYPLTSIHPYANSAAIAAEAAREQGKFYEFHDLLFAHQDDFISPDFSNEVSGTGSSLVPEVEIQNSEDIPIEINTEDSTEVLEGSQ